MVYLNRNERYRYNRNCLEGQFITIRSGQSQLVFTAINDKIFNKNKFCSISIWAWKRSRIIERINSVDEFGRFINRPTIAEIIFMEKEVIPILTSSKLIEFMPNIDYYTPSAGLWKQPPNWWQKKFIA